MLVSYFYEIKNQTSKYAGVCWKKNSKKNIYKNKWQTILQHNQKRYYAGYHDNQENAAMSINLICDKLGIKRKHPTINTNLDEIQQVTNRLTIDCTGERKGK